MPGWRLCGVTVVRAPTAVPAPADAAVRAGPPGVAAKVKVFGAGTSTT